MDATWTLTDLVTEARARLAALPPPRNGQVRAVPDERTIRYYAALGLLDRPAAMRGRTALYGARHLAQVVAIKRMQGAGKSLADIQALWGTLDDATLARMSGVAVPGARRAAPARREFWKREVTPGPAPLAGAPSTAPRAVAPHSSPAPLVRSPGGDAQRPPMARLALRIELAPGAVLAVDVDEGVSLSAADVRALRAAAAPLVTELAQRGLAAQIVGTLEEEP